MTRLLHRDRLVGTGDLAIRAVSVAARAAFLVALARWMPAADYGRLAMTLALTSYLIYVAGLDFYITVHRAYLAGDSDLAHAAKAQLTVLAGGFALSLPVIGALHVAGISVHSMWLVTGLLLGEAVCAEVARLLVVAERPSLANIVNFMKAAGWMLPVLAFGYRMPGATLIPIIYGAWAVGLFFAAALGIRGLGLTVKQLIGTLPIRALVVEHLRLMPVLAISTLSFRALFSLDRIFVDKTVGPTGLAPYTLFAGMGAAFMALVDAGVAARLYPLLVRAAIRRDATESRCLIREMLMRIGILIALMMLAIHLGLPLLLEFIGKPTFSTQAHLAWIVAIGYSCHAVSMPFGYVLYGTHHDRHVMWIHLLGAVLLVAISAIGIDRGTAAWTAVGVLVAFVYMTTHKILLTARVMRDFRGP